MEKHTPGPWEWGFNPAARPGHSNELVVRPRGEFPHGAWIADCGWITDERAKANARLIAAAPELVEALEATLAVLDVRLAAGPYDGRGDEIAIADMARAALAKAKEA